MADGGFAVPESQSPWQQYFREMVQPFDKGMTLRDAPDYRDIARKHMPRDNH
jgi:dihydroxy-acid dehydratase